MLPHLLIKDEIDLIHQRVWHWTHAVVASFGDSRHRTQ